MNEIIIHNLCEYIELLDRIYVDRIYEKLGVNPFYDEDLVFFRGQNNKHYSVLPSIARPTGSSELILQEHKMVNEFLYKKPREFEGMNSSFNILAKMQHYGLPTRLLDITKNPLVALYFASEPVEEKNELLDGEVLFFICGTQHLNYSTSLDAILLSSFYKERLNSYIDLEDFVFGDTRIEEMVSKRFESDGNYDYLANRMESYVFVLPNYYDDRQIRQSSAFVLFPNKLEKFTTEDGKNNYIIRPSISDIKSRVTELMESRIIIKAKSKTKIRAQLSMVGINEEFLFPDMDRVADNIQRTAKKIKTRFFDGLK